MTNINHTPKALIHKSELDFISKCVMDYPNIETGGDFFGFWTKDGNPVVQYVIGPGENTTRTETSFYQDIPYLKKCGILLNGKFGLEHIGGWHSHHRLSLAQPSSGDVNTMRNALRDNNLPNFLISICNIGNKANVTINGFLFSKKYENDYVPCQWEVLKGTSPIRESLQKSNSDIFITPGSQETPIEVINPKEERPSTKNRDVEKPELPDDSYWTKKEGREYLKMVFEKLKNKEALSNVELLQLPDNRIAISFDHNKGSYEIRFPNDFPKNPPEVIEKMPVDGDGIIPESIKKMFRPSKKRENNIQQFIHSLDIVEKNTLFLIKFL